MGTTERTIEWTSQNLYLWTGRRNGMPIGTIEQGARFAFIGVTGDEHRGFSSLQAAQEAAERLVSEPAR